MNKSNFDVSELRIKSDKIKKKLKIAHVSDLHSCEYKEILELIKNENPDFVAVTGDFSERYNGEYKRGIDFLREASEICAVFVSLGNHDVDVFKEIDLQIIKKSGAILLDNEFIKYGEIYIGGLTSAKAFSNFDFLKDFSQEEEYKLLLCHHPEYYNRFLKNYDLDLILSGHAHGGQIRIPLIGGIFSPGQGLFPHLTSGFKFNKLVISRGLGNPNNLPRWFNKPELIFIELLNE